MPSSSTHLSLMRGIMKLLHALISLSALFLLLLAACSDETSTSETNGDAGPDDTSIDDTSIDDTSTDDTSTDDTSTDDTSNDDANNGLNNHNAPADNIVNILGTCDGMGRRPDRYPNQLGPGTDLHRYTLQAGDAVCNDGSPAVLFVRTATDVSHQNDWVMHLQGGGSCNTHEECAQRWCGSDYYDASKMSSNWAPESVVGRGINNPDSSLNDVAGWNHVFFYYCSSDGWSGVSEAGLEDDDGDEFTLFRHGHMIIERAFEDMADGLTSDNEAQTLPRLDSAARVIWSGTSAGAGGARIHADWVTELLGPETEVAAVFDAAQNPPAGAFSDELAAAVDVLARESYQQRLMQDAVPPFADASCLEHVPESDHYRCRQSTVLLRDHITTPYFVRMDLKDSNAVQNFVAAGVAPDVFANAVRDFLLELKSIQQTGAEGDVVSRAPGVYGPNCGQHVGMETNPWFFVSSIDVEGENTSATFHDALLRWLSGTDVEVVGYADGRLSNCEVVDEDR